MIQIALTLPITSATCERSFSAVRKYLYIEKDKTKALNNEAILNTFYKKCKRIIKLS